MEPQRHILDLKHKDFRKNDAPTRTILVTPGNTEIFAYCEYGYTGVEESSSGAYAISWIARSVKYDQYRLGDQLLGIVLDDIAVDAFHRGRTPLVVTQIDPRNTSSIHLFAGRGFHDDGIDPDDSGFHIWSSALEPHDSIQVNRQFVIELPTSR
ncbi:N-acetyltransferase [Bifidobacterium sp. ESL0732]|uniref:N-acetyltransferase n=1 Tax=Bifidobacterium sp. ESL0732 TaxID=2983222 RepID=UPI0023F7980F|nr:N-acetyltransferase [Bifidobacterium sp. ESL0732]WEV64187.1 N-acetyltransferase [Bifidobacterium sp. ESL0732]